MGGNGRNGAGGEELARGEGDSGALHEGARAHVPQVDAGPRPPRRHRLRAPHPPPGVPDARLLDPGSPQ